MTQMILLAEKDIETIIITTFLMVEKVKIEHVKQSCGR